MTEGSNSIEIVETKEPLADYTIPLYQILAKETAKDVLTKCGYKPLAVSEPLNNKKPCHVLH